METWMPEGIKEEKMEMNAGRIEVMITRRTTKRTGVRNEGRK